MQLRFEAGRPDGLEPDVQPPPTNTQVACSICTWQLDASSGSDGVCSECKSKYPAALIKATADHPFDYALRLRSGELIYFTGAKIIGSFARLTVSSQEDFPGKNRKSTGLPAHAFPNGIEVFIGEIVWCTDAPDGT